jgi:iron(III) transport system ATP-binding protein
MEKMEPVLDVTNIAVSYGGKAVVRDVSLELEKGNIGCILGPSGCGKTTLLRATAGFEPLQCGSIAINGLAVSTVFDALPPEKRRIGMVFQDYALFPHLTVKENVTFGLRGIPVARREAIADELMDLMALEKASEVYPHELSGGQQQRVAMARALALEPMLLLMDEPFSNLDVTLREKLSTDIRNILKDRGISALMVTHNQGEAFAMGDVIGVMSEGKLLQWDSAYNLYHRPVNTEVADFVGEGVLLTGRVTGAGEVKTELGTLKGQFSYPCEDGCPAAVLLRPEDIVHDHQSPLTARIVKKNFRGPNILYTLALPSRDTVLSLVPSHHNHGLGETIGIRPEVDEIILFPRSAISA